MPMEPRTPTTADDRTCGLAFLMVAAFASSLVWLYMLFGHLAVR
jgi:hypothetical protein